MDRLTNNHQRNIDYLDNILNIDECFDIGRRTVNVSKQTISNYFVNGLTDQDKLETLYQTIMMSDINQVINYLPLAQIKEENRINDLIEAILSGLSVFIINDCDSAYIIDCRSYPSRSVSEPDTEKTVRGAKDGFTENIITNVGLIRRRIRKPNLVTKMYKIGNISRTDVCLLYMKGLADERVVDFADKRLTNIDIDELSMTDKKLEELLLKQRYNPYPLVRYSERPDVISKHLIDGYIAIVVDNSASVILGPINIFDLLEHPEEYRQAPIIGTFLRIIRILGVLLSILLLPIWYLANKNPNVGAFFGQFVTENTITIPIFLQILIAAVGIELIRLAAIHTPTAISSAMGLLAGVIIGEVAIELGYFIKDIVFYTAISQIGNFVTPNYELSLSNKILMLFILVLVFIFDIYGLIIGLMLAFIFLANIKSFNKPYLYPLWPLNIKKLIGYFIRYNSGNYKHKNK